MFVGIGAGIWINTAHRASGGTEQPSEPDEPTGPVGPSLSISNYAIWDAEDAGDATWTARFSAGAGVGQYFIKHGDVDLVAISGHTMIDCSNGCYYGDKTASPFPSTLPFDVWSVVRANDSDTTVFYNGPQVMPGSANAANIRLSLKEHRLRVSTGIASFAAAITDDTVRSFHWSRPENGGIAECLVYQDGTALERTGMTNRAIDASGAYFVVGGSTNGFGEVVPAPDFRLSKLIVTFGENLSEADRAALDAWWRT